MESGDLVFGYREDGGVYGVVVLDGKHEEKRMKDEL
jgi:hypothetical protein